MHDKRNLKLLVAYPYLKSNNAHLKQHGRVNFNLYDTSTQRLWSLKKYGHTIGETYCNKKIKSGRKVFLRI